MHVSECSHLFVFLLQVFFIEGTSKVNARENEHGVQERIHVFPQPHPLALQLVHIPRAVNILLSLRSRKTQDLSECLKLCIF